MYAVRRNFPATPSTYSAKICHLLVISTQGRKGTHQFWQFQIVIFEKFCVGKIRQQLIVVSFYPQYFSSLIFKYVATNLSFEYAWFLSNFGLNVSKFRIRQASDYWIEKSQVALMFSIVVTYIDKMNQ